MPIHDSNSSRNVWLVIHEMLLPPGSIHLRKDDGNDAQMSEFIKTANSKVLGVYSTSKEAKIAASLYSQHQVRDQENQDGVNRETSKQLAASRSKKKFDRIFVEKHQVRAVASSAAKPDNKKWNWQRHHRGSRHGSARPIEGSPKGQAVLSDVFLARFV